MSQEVEGGLDGALRQARFFRDRTQTGLDRFPSCPRSQAEEMKVDQIRRWLTIVADDVAHQNVEDVVVDRDGFAESGHAKSKKEELRSRKRQMSRYTVKRTAAKIVSLESAGSRLKAASDRPLLLGLSVTNEQPDRVIDAVKRQYERVGLFRGLDAPRSRARTRIRKGRLLN